MMGCQKVGEVLSLYQSIANADQFTSGSDCGKSMASIILVPDRISYMPFKNYSNLTK